MFLPSQKVSKKPVRLEIALIQCEMLLLMAALQNRMVFVEQYVLKYMIQKFKHSVVVNVFFVHWWLC